MNSSNIATKIYEIVRVQVLLGKRHQFQTLHRTILMPVCRELGIKVEHCLMVEVGSIGEVTDIYSYSSYMDYDRLTSKLEEALIKRDYYKQIQECIKGTIHVSLTKTLL